MVFIAKLRGLFGNDTHEGKIMKQESFSNDRLIERALRSLRKEYLLVGKAHVRAWHVWLLLGIIVGAVAAFVFVVNRSGKFTLSLAADTIPPSISSVSVGNILAFSASVTFLTNESANSYVEYGLATTYGSQSDTQGPATSFSISLSGLSGNTSYHYRIVATDLAGNISKSSDKSFKTKTFQISSVKVASITSTDATINFTTSGTATAFVKYGPTNSYGAQSAVQPSATSFSVVLSGLSPSTPYHYRIVAQDPVSGSLTQSSDKSFKTLSASGSSGGTTIVVDVIPPSVPAALAAYPYSPSQIALSWNVSSDTAGVVGYVLYRQGVRIGTTPNSSYIDSGLLASTTYTYTVAAYDAAGNYSLPSDPASATTQVIPSPPPPSTKFSINDRVQTIANLSVRSSPSLSGSLLGIQSNGSLGTIIGGPTFADNYWWWNVNYDNNPDGWSAEDYLQKFVPDTVSPSVPSGLSAGAVSTTAVGLSWNASQDNVGVAVYRIYRGGVQIASVSGLSYTDTGLIVSTTYSYTVAAVDAAGNVSAQSVPVSVTTQTSWLPVGSTITYKGSGKIWIASRITQDTIVFANWTDPISNDTAWRSKSTVGNIISESATEIHYGSVTFYDGGVPADPFGNTDGPYDIRLTPNDISLTITDGITVAHFAGSRIGITSLPPVFSRQWCGYTTICQKAVPGDTWDGWAIWILPLQQENSIEIAFLFFMPYSRTNRAQAIETVQGFIHDHGSFREIHGYEGSPCTSWVTTLGLCRGGALAYNGVNATLRARLEGNNLRQWWMDPDTDSIAECSEFGSAGSAVPDAVYPHGTAATVASRTLPTRQESTWLGLTEGGCTGAPRPTLTVSATTFSAGASVTATIYNGVPGASVAINCISPTGISCSDINAGVVDLNGRFTKTYNTTGWGLGTYKAWATESGLDSNTINFTVTSP